MKKKIIITVKKDPLSITKETPEERKLRLRTQRTFTRVIPDKKNIYDRKKFKEEGKER